MNKVKVDTKWLEQVTVDVIHVTAAVRDLHKPHTYPDGDVVCYICYEGGDYAERVPYPCDTIKALNDDTDTLERDDDYDSRRDDYQEEDLG